MGGCKCAYTSCKKSTDGVTHFFHFPVRDEHRCRIWIENCKRPEFDNLTLSQLKNKVICQNHFVDKMFLNYKHDRLIHKAVPTIEFYDSTQESVSITNKGDEVLFNVMITPINAEFTPPKRFVKGVQKHHSTPYSMVKNKKNLRNSSLSSVDGSTILFNKNNSTLINKTLTEKEKDSTPKETIKSAKEKDSMPKEMSKSEKDKRFVLKETPNSEKETDSVSKETPKSEKETDSVSKETLKSEKETDSMSKEISNSYVKSMKVGVANLPMEINFVDVETFQQKESWESPIINVQKDNKLASKIVSVQSANNPAEQKKIVIHSVVDLPEKNRIDYMDLKARSLLRVKDGRITKICKPKLLNSALKIDSLIDKRFANLSLPSVTESEAVISQTPVMKKPSYVALIDEQLRRFNRDRGFKTKFIKSESSISPNKPMQEQTLQPNVKDNDYMKLILKTQEEMMEIKKMLQNTVLPTALPAPVVVQETAFPKLSKEVLFAAIVPYLSAELSKKVHSEMFPSLAINAQPPAVSAQPPTVGVQPPTETIESPAISVQSAATSVEGKTA